MGEISVSTRSYLFFFFFLGSTQGDVVGFVVFFELVEISWSFLLVGVGGKKNRNSFPFQVLTGERGDGSIVVDTGQDPVKLVQEGCCVGSCSASGHLKKNLVLCNVA